MAGIARWRPLRAATAVAVAIVLSQLAGLGLTEAAGDTDQSRGLGIIAADLLMLGMVVWAARVGTERLGARTLGLMRTRFGAALGWSLAVLFGSFAFNGLLAATFGSGRYLGGTSGGPITDTGMLVLLAAGIAVVAPIVEELVFRGYLFPALSTWRGPWVGAVLCALLFGAAHVLSLPIPFQLGAAAFGFGACLLYWFTGSLLPGIALHSLNNAIVLAAVTDGRLALAIPVAPVLAVLIVLPLARERARVSGEPLPT